MGLLTKGIPLSWLESKAFHDYIREHGIDQLINIFRQFKDRQNDPFLWGEEVEAMIVSMDPEHQLASLACEAPKLLEQLELLKQKASVVHCH